MTKRATSRTNSDKGIRGQRGKPRKLEYQFYSWDLPQAAKRVSEGLATYSLEAVQKSLKLSSSEFAHVISVSPRTLTRRRKEERLPPEESERVYRVGRLAEMAALVLGEEEAREWMREPNFALGNKLPLEMMRTEPGAELVERVLHQIDHGITV